MQPLPRGLDRNTARGPRQANHLLPDAVRKGAIRAVLLARLPAIARKVRIDGHKLTMERAMQQFGFSAGFDSLARSN